MDWTGASGRARMLASFGKPASRARMTSPTCSPPTTARSESGLRRALVRIGGHPGLRLREVADPETLDLTGHQERQRAQRRAYPVLVADHGHAIKRRRVPRPETRVRLHGIALDLACLRAHHVEQAHLASFGDLLAKQRLDRVLPVIVLDLA